MFAPRSRCYLFAVALVLVGCTGRTSAVDSVTNSIVGAPAMQAVTSGSLRMFPVATNDNFPRPIAVGSDGDIWFGAATASGAPELGRIDLTGKTSYFPT